VKECGKEYERTRKEYPKPLLSSDPKENYVCDFDIAFMKELLKAHPDASKAAKGQLADPHLAAKVYVTANYLRLERIMELVEVCVALNLKDLPIDESISYLAKEDVDEVEEKKE
jgi:hypothetical protein